MVVYDQFTRHADAHTYENIISTTYMPQVCRFRSGQCQAERSAPKPGTALRHRLKRKALLEHTVHNVHFVLLSVLLVEAAVHGHPPQSGSSLVRPLRGCDDAMTGDI